MSNPRSFWSLLFCAVVMIYCSFAFYPRWTKYGANATISWDVAGYYWPVPAAFVYKDFVSQRFGDSIIRKYKPATDQQVAIDFDGKGHHIFRYTFGTSILYIPFFAVAHLLAKPLGFPADGFSWPYQFAIQAGALLFAFLGLLYFRKLFLKYHSDTVVAVLLFLLCIGSNYLNYATIDNGLSHCWLFTLYVFLLLNIHYFYLTPGYKYAVRVGLLIGLITLVRPPEAICCMLFVLWGMNSIGTAAIRERLICLKRHWNLFLVAGICSVAVISIQLLYWKIVAGHWIMDTYPGQGFSFLHPHFREYMVSYRSGWITYTPLMILAFLGIIPFLRNGQNKLAVLLFSLVSLYIVASWDIWWYAGSGGRAMIQSYPVLLFPLASLIKFVWDRRVMKWIFIGLASLFTYVNIWFTYHAHADGGLYDSAGMNKDYFQRVIGRWTAPADVRKLEDYEELFEGTPKNMKLLYHNDFENDTTLHMSSHTVQGERSYLMDPGHRSSGWFMFAMPAYKAQRVRVQATYNCPVAEGNRYKWSQLMVRLYNKGEVVKEKMIYVDRFLSDSTISDVYIDVKIPGGAIDSGGVSFWGESVTLPVYIDNLKVWSFDE